MRKSGSPKFYQGQVSDPGVQKEGEILLGTRYYEYYPGFPLRYDSGQGKGVCSPSVIHGQIEEVD